ncbi:MAG: hypothetical protein K5857_10035 [Lachnospiraceae bacterium]|nr:hypothetical protein [Lachnospiraceae bacterium]
MDNLFNKRSVIAIVTGTILLTVTNLTVWFTPAVDDRWAIRICAVILVIVASVSGILAGILIPVASCLFTGVVFSRPDAFLEMVLLLVTGAIMGHYSDKLEVSHGRFGGIYILDFTVIATGASIIAWLCIQPLAVLYVNLVDLRESISVGMDECLISVGAKLLICLPILLILNHFYRKRQMVEDAKREYLYHAGK